MPVFDLTGSYKIAGDLTANIQVQQTGSIVNSAASFLNFRGEAVTSVVNNGVGVDVTLNTGSVQWVEGSPSPRLRTTASVSVSGQSDFAQTKGADVYFYVSGTQTTGSSSDKVSVFGGTVVISSSLTLCADATTPSQSYIQFEKSNGDPGPADADMIRIHGVSRANRAFLGMKGPSGLGVTLQPSIYNNMVAWFGPANTTTVTQLGLAMTTTGTISHPAPIAVPVSGIMGTVRNIRFLVAGAISGGNSAGVLTPAAYVWRGTYSGSGGWYYFCRFNRFIDYTDSRCFVGMQAGSSFVGSTTDVSATTNIIGIGYDRLDPATGTWRIIRRDSGAVVRDDIPNMFRSDTTGSLIDFHCFSPPNGQGIYVQVIEHVSMSGGSQAGVVALNRWEQFYTSSIPPAASFLRITACASQGTASNMGIQFQINRLYLESDY